MNRSNLSKWRVFKLRNFKWYVFKLPWGEEWSWVATLGPYGAFNYYRTQEEALEHALRMIENKKCIHTADNYFDRTVCPKPCGSMHYRCRECDEVVDTEGCLNEIR